MKIFLSRLCMNLDSVFGRTNWIIPPHHESGRHYGSTLMLILGPQKYFKLTTHNRYLYTDVQATPFQQSFLCSFAAGPTLVPVPSLTAGPTKPPPQGPTQGKPPQLGPTAGNSSMIIIIVCLLFLQTSLPHVMFIVYIHLPWTFIHSSAYFLKYV